MNNIQLVVVYVLALVVIPIWGVWLLSVIGI